ncbi:hypothetical protein Vadar_029720 [Vaccinium darrowii]|uniref:Uncharacterized protein n=1 Tax=Vaccinium darrowii TaxID=229202 RepID=A0ACB7XD74_9ERIC|nr:hypothetical protein Vadar_029720 [Vaccinium darrowii]
MKRVDKQDFDGGWIPVTHKHASHGGNFKSGKQPLITLFVDNLPEDTSQPWLKMMFNKFGVVKEVFIPGKRSKTTGNRFGFVRYDCAVSADLAILRTNGIWLDDKKLFVKLASFEAKGTKPVPSNSNREGVIYQTGLGLTKEQGSGANVVVQNHTFLQNSIGFSAKPSMSYSEALKGGTNVNGYSKIKSVIVAEVTDSWLQRSAIAKLKSFQSIKAVHKLFFDKGFKIAQIKPMGGLNLVITFHSIELLDSLLAEENLDFSNWFVSFQKWNGQACPPSRNVWLSCFGVPLNVWCDNTFLSIGGLWGDVVALEEKTQKSLAFDRGRVLVATNIMDRIDEVINLSINGALAKVRVIEDLTSYFTSSDNYNFGDEIGDRKTTHSKIVDEEDDMAPDLCKLTHAEGF